MRKAWPADRQGYLTPPVLIILAIIISILALILLINAGLLKQLRTQQPPTTIDSSPTTQQTSKAQDETDRPPSLYPKRVTMTADKKSYTHNGYGFSFQFPKEWVVVSDSLPESPNENGGYGGTLEIDDISTTENPSLAVRVDTAYGVAEADIEYKLSLVGDGWKLTDRIVVPPRTQIQGGTTPHQDDGMTLIRAVRTIKSNQYWIDFSFTEGGKDYEPEFRQILSTFQFID